MNLRLVLSLLLLGSVMSLSAALVLADEPPAPVVVEEPAEPIKNDSADDAAAETKAEPAPTENAGLEDLDKATQLKVTAENLPDLNDVVDKLDSAIEKGLDKDNQAFADQLLISALLQRATVLSAAVLDRPLADPRRDPRWMQVRQFAVNDVQRVLSLDDKVWEAHLLMGRLQALPMGDSKTAKRELTIVIDSTEATPDERAQAFAVRGTLQTDEQKRADDFDAAIELLPRKPDYYRLRAQYRYGQDKFDDALKDFNKAVELEPDHAATLLLRANILYQLKDTEAALKDVEAAIKAQPDQLIAHLLQAEILASSDRVDEAIEKLEKLLPLAPNQTKLLEPLATFYLVGGQPRKSIETFTKVIELEPENYRALRFRGDASLGIGKHAEAVADFDAALKLHAEDDGLLNNFAWVLATSPDDKVRDGKRAVELATKAAELSSYTVPHILSTLAAAYAETGDFENAKKWSKQAVELSKDDETRDQLSKELSSYEAGKPWRESQQQKEKKPGPSTSDHTFAPPSAAPAPARTLDF